MEKVGFVTLENAISSKMCDVVMSEVGWENSYKATTFDMGYTPEYRETDVVGHHCMSPVGCILQAHSMSANHQFWGYEVSGCETLQYCRYAKSGHYDWHHDAQGQPGTDYFRVLTAIMFLNDESEYEGGELELELEDKSIVSIRGKKGSILVFPSRTMHRVLPVLSGNRYTAVLWTSGPHCKQD